MCAKDWQEMKRTEAEKLFLEKMAVLNKTFLYFIQCSLKEMPDADLSPCVRDYLKHVEDLDRTYGNMELAPNGGSTSISTDDIKKDKIISELPKSNLPEKDVSDGSGMKVKSSATPIHEDIAQEKSASNEITVNSITNSASVPKLSFDTSTTSLTGSEKRGRKRAKKGGPEGGDEEVIISNHNSPVSPRYSTSSEKSHIKTTSNQTSLSSPLSSLFNSSTAETVLKKDFGGKVDSKTEIKNGSFQKKDIDDIKETGTSKIPLFLFSQQNDLKKNELLGNSPNFVFNKSSSEKGLAENLNEKKERNDELTSKSHVTPAFSFFKPIVTEGNYECSDSSKTKLEFKFDAQPTVQSEPNDESEDTEYVPPKPTAVLTEEPKAIFSSKCSVFVLKGTEYEKLGIGQLHIKTDETDSGKKILLIRAATTTGTVWVNSYIDDTMKHVTVEDVKLRISCVSSGSPSTYLLRLPKREDRDQVVAELQDDNTSS